MPHYKLYYFDLRGLGEPIRALLRYTGQQYEEERIKLEDWSVEVKSRYPYEKVPLLEVDGKPLAETHAICRYLGRKYGWSVFRVRLCGYPYYHILLTGLAGKDAWEEAKVDEFSDFHKDAFTELIPYVRAKKALMSIYAGYADVLYKEQFLPAVEKYFPLYEKQLQDSSSGFIAFSGLTWVDFLVAERFNMLHTMHPEIVDRYPELEMYRQRVNTKTGLAQG